jgi:hypothetical protein
MTLADLEPNLLYEKQVASFSRLMTEIKRLDSDAGVRLMGTLKGRRCFVFVTKSLGGYTAIVCAIRNAANPIPGERLLSKQFTRTKELEAFLLSLTGGHVQAYVY